MLRKKVMREQSMKEFTMDIDSSPSECERLESQESED